MKYLNAILGSLCAPYLLLTFATQELYPWNWTVAALVIWLSAFVGLAVLSVVILRSLDEAQKELDKYFKDVN